MLAVVRSELVRLRRPRMLILWFGLMALFALMVNTVMFGTASSGTTLPAGAPGVRFPDAATLAGPDGLVAGLAAASSMFGVVTLSFWALATATDYSSGLIRLLVAARAAPLAPTGRQGHRAVDRDRGRGGSGHGRHRDGRPARGAGEPGSRPRTG